MRYSRDFTITKEHLQRFYQMLVLRRWRKGIAGFAVVGALVLKLYMDWLGFEFGTIGMAAMMALGGLLTAVFITIGIMLRTRGNVSQMMRKKGTASYVKQVRIDGFGVHVTVGDEKSKLGFDKLKLVRETKDAFYLFVTDNDAWIMPKEQMENAQEECRAIREIFTKVVAPSRRKLGK